MTPDSSESSSDLDPDEDPTLHTLNTRAVVGLVLSVAVGIGGLFILPVLESVVGLGFGVAFGLTLAIEFVAFLGVAVSVLRLHRRKTFD